MRGLGAYARRRFAMITGLGLEVVEVERFERAVERWGRALLTRLFTEKELFYCLSKRRPGPHLAARFAAKAAFLKAAGMGLAYRAVEVTRDDKGRPGIRPARYTSGTEPGGRGMYVETDSLISLTITHTAQIAMAAVIIERRTEREASDEDS